MLSYYAAILCCVFPATTLHHQARACKGCKQEAEDVEEGGAGATGGGKFVADLVIPDCPACTDP